MDLCAQASFKGGQAEVVTGGAKVGICRLVPTDTKEEALILNQLQEQALLKTLLQGRDPRLYQQLYGLKNVRDVWDPPTRGASGKFMVLPFFDR